MPAVDKSSFDWQMHYFRAFAILMIMATHYCGVFGFDLLDRNFFRSSTIFFLFISGYLCQHIFDRRPQPPLTYFKKKLLNVISPFLVFSISIGLLRGDSPMAVSFWRDVLLGRIQLQYWYIPFVSVLFLVSPVLCRLKNRVLVPLTAASLLLLVLFPIRPEPVFAIAWPHTFHLYAYFTFFYLFGFVYCRYRKQMFGALKRNAIAVFALALAVSSVMPFFCSDALHAVHKTLLGAVILLLTDLIKSRKILVLDLLARYSFTLYFLHLGIFLQTRPFHDYLVSHLRLPVISELATFAIYVLAMLLASILAKSLLGTRSRPLLAT